MRKLLLFIKKKKFMIESAANTFLMLMVLPMHPPHIEQVSIWRSRSRPNMDTPEHTHSMVVRYENGISIFSVKQQHVPNGKCIKLPKRIHNASRYRITLHATDNYVQ